MKLSIQKALFFLGGVAAMLAYSHLKNERLLSELRMDKDACSFVWEEHEKPTITTNTGYWEDGVTECMVFDNGRFRSLTSSERTSYEASLESHFRD